MGNMFGGFGSVGKQPKLGFAGRGNRSVPGSAAHRNSNAQQTTKPLPYDQVMTHRKGRSTKSS